MKQKYFLCILILALVGINHNSAQTDPIDQLLKSLGLGDLKKNLTSGIAVDWVNVLKTPFINETLHSNGIDPKMVIDVVTNIDMQELIKALKVLDIFNLYLAGNTTGVTSVIANWDYDKIISTIKIKNVVKILLKDKKIMKEIKALNLDPKMILELIEIVNINGALKALDIENIVKNVLTGGKKIDVQIILDNLDYAKILKTIDIPKAVNIIFKYVNITEGISGVGVSVKMVERLLASIDPDDLVKAIDIKKIFKYVMAGKTDNITKVVLESVKFDKLLKMVTDKKFIIKLITGDATKALSTLSPPCLMYLTKLVAPFKNSSLQDTLPKLMSSPLAKYIDSWAKPPSRVLHGNIRWLGAYDECKEIPNAKYCFSKMVLFGQDNPLVPGYYASCVPSQCTTSDVFKILKVAENITSKYIAFGKPTCEEPVEYKTGFKITLVLCVVICVLFVIGTILELLIGSNVISYEVKESISSNENNIHMKEIEKQDDTEYMEEAMVFSTEKRTNSFFFFCTNISIRKENFLVKFFLCFGLHKNARQVLSTEVPKNAIGCINGIRTISMMWVILGHLYFFGMLSPLDNPLTVAKIFHTYKFLPISNAYVSVDTFFLLSGLLVAFLGLRRMDKNEGCLNIPMFYLHRFIRLTPPYMFVILFWNNIFPLIITGPLSQNYRNDEFQEACNNYWWTNLLYINNFYPKMAKECLGWSWYLANDMQFYIISPIFLILIYRFDRHFEFSRYRYFFGYLIIAVACFISFIVTASIIGVKNYPVLITAAIFPGNPRSKHIQESQDELYIKPYIRAPPYLVGILLGYILSRKVTIKPRYKKLLYSIGWISSILFAYGVIFGPWGVFKKGGEFFTLTQAVCYGSLHRLAFGISVAWVIYACHNKAAGYINDLLSMRVWVPMSRLTFGAYLLHPLVIMFFFNAQGNAYHYAENLVVFDFISLTFVSYACAFLLAVFVEYPVSNLEKMAFKL